MAGVDKYFERSSRYVLQEQYESLRIDSLGKLESFQLSSQGEPPVPLPPPQPKVPSHTRSQSEDKDFGEGIKSQKSIRKEVKRSFSLPNEGKREFNHRKLSRPSRKSFSPDKETLWEENLPRTKEEAGDQERRISVAVYGSYRKESTHRGRFHKPIDRFRIAVSQVKVLNALKKAAELQRKTYNQNTSSFALIQKELNESKHFSSSDGLLFDPSFYKAQKEIQLANEAMYILSINPEARTEEQINSVITMVKASVPAFGEYPFRMQRQLLSVGWYEKFETNRVIIRQGHRALNFYFILSGSAIVSLTTKDKSTGVSKDTTVAILGKGHSFGELALLHDTARTATVICQSEVVLLAVSRQDFIDIFLRSTDNDEEQEHIRFLKSVSFFKRFPLEDCNGRIGTCLCHYFRRGVVIEKDPLNTEWIYVVKSGSCRVLTRVAKPRTDATCHYARKLPVLKEDTISRNVRLRRKILQSGSSLEQEDGGSNNSLMLPDINPLETLRPRTHSGPSRNAKASVVNLVEDRKKTLDDMVLKKSKNELYANKIPMKNSKHGTFIYTSKSEDDLKKGEEKHRKNLMKLAELHRMEMNSKANKTANSNTQEVLVQTELLKPKDQFGLASIIYHDPPQTKSYLVSNGAECVLISKAWLKQNANESLLRVLRSEISPTPSAYSLQQNLQDQVNWNSYKSEVVNGIISSHI